MNKDNRTDEELNRIIAEWCGWVPSDGDHKCRNAWLEITGEDWPIRPPNYCRDLNAVHEAVMKLDPNRQWDYGESIRTITGCVGPKCGKHPLNGYGIFVLTEATARQRAEALVKVIEEGKR